MKFLAKDSKLFSEIMEGVVAFFSLDAETTTETDIHAALDGAEPLATQLDKAKGQPDATLTKERDDLKAEVEALKTEVETQKNKVSETEKALGVKDARIAELQVEAEAAKGELETQKAQHKAEISTLSGKVAKLTAGKSKEIELNDDENGNSKFKNSNKDEDVVVVKSSKLSKLTEKQNLN